MHHVNVIAISLSIMDWLNSSLPVVKQSMRIEVSVHSHPEKQNIFLGTFKTNSVTDDSLDDHIIKHASDLAICFILAVKKCEQARGPRLLPGYKTAWSETNSLNRSHGTDHMWPPRRQKSNPTPSTLNNRKSPSTLNNRKSPPYTDGSPSTIAPLDGTPL